MLDLTLLETVLALHARQSGVSCERTLTNFPREFLSFCQRHQVTAYVWGLLEQSGFAQSLDPAVAKGFQLAQLDQWQRSERLLRDLKSLHARFGQHGQELIVMKGPYLAKRFFGGIERRAFSDIDILVRSNCLTASLDLLQAEGYAAVSPLKLPDWTRRFLHHIELKKGGRSLDLHHTLRAHPTFRISEEALWTRTCHFDFGTFSCRVLPDDLTLLVQILSIHADVGLGLANLKLMLDLDRVVEACSNDIDWPAFLSDRERDRTLGITLNVLAMLLTIFRSTDHYPELTRLLQERKTALVWQPDRNRYLQLLGGTTLRTAKTWALRQYDQTLLSALTTWAMSLPVMALGLGKSFSGNLRHRELGLPSPGSRHRPVTAGLWDSPQDLIKGLGGDPRAIAQCRVRLGSLTLRLYYTDEKYLAMLAELFRLQALPVDDDKRAWDEEDHLLLFDVAEEPFRAIIPQPTQPLVDRTLEGIIEIHRDAACCLLSRADERVRLAIPVISASQEYAHLLHCVMVVLYRALFSLECLPLHSAAIQFGKAANLFIGDKGAGKSTVSFRLGLAGGRVLGEDHIILRRRHGKFFVSGCDGKSRLTAKSEEHFFTSPLPATAVDVAGVLKKEINLADHVCSAPFEDVPVGRIFFSSVGKILAFEKMNGAEALAKILNMTRERLRFSGAQDRKRFLDFVGDFLGSTEIWNLTLSEDLNELDKLVAFVKDGKEYRHGETV
jgi:hypothetical protein